MSVSMKANLIRLSVLENQLATSVPGSDAEQYLVRTIVDLRDGLIVETVTDADYSIPSTFAA